MWVRCSNPELGEEDFGDLFLNDFILAQKRVSRVCLDKLEMCPQLKGLLERGALHALEKEELRNPEIEVSIGYASAVGVALAAEIGLLHKAVGVFQLPNLAGS